MLPEGFIFVLVAGIGQLDGQGSNLGLVENRQDIGQRHIVIVGPVIIPPADMQPDTLGRDILGRTIDGFDMNLDGLLEFGECLLLKEKGPLHSQVWSVELQQ